jgi:hypothetical protein
MRGSAPSPSDQDAAPCTSRQAALCTVGYVFSEKKRHSLLTPEFVECARCVLPCPASCPVLPLAAPCLFNAAFAKTECAPCPQLSRPPLCAGGPVASYGGAGARARARAQAPASLASFLFARAPRLLAAAASPPSGARLTAPPRVRRRATRSTWCCTRHAPPQPASPQRSRITPCAQLPLSSPHFRHWEQRLASYKLSHPWVSVVDTPQAAHQVRAGLSSARRRVPLTDLPAAHSSPTEPPCCTR